MPRCIFALFLKVRTAQLQTAKLRGTYSNYLNPSKVYKDTFPFGDFPQAV